MAVIDQKKSLGALYGTKSREPLLVKVPRLTYLMADGKGDPASSKEFAGSVGALYGLSYTMKFMLKKEGVDFTVMPLEGLFWADDMSAFIQGRRVDWQWTLMILQPAEVTKKLLQGAQAELIRKKKLVEPAPVRLASLSEGQCVQVLHLGPYAEERPTIEKLHSFMTDSGYTFNGKHHEIYLSDPNRTAPPKLRTIIRQPVRKAP